MSETNQDKEQSSDHERFFTDIFSDDLTEAFCKENYAGTWTIEQLEQMESEFNVLPLCNEKQRKTLLYRFLNANVILHIIIDRFTLVSEYAYRKDLLNEQFDGMRRAELMSKHLSQFSKIRFGPPCKTEEEPLHDAHVKKLVYSKIPIPYQRKYPDEPALLASLRRCEDNKSTFEISIEDLVPVNRFCRCCVSQKQRETFQTILLSKITSIRLYPKENGFYDLVIETLQ